MKFSNPYAEAVLNTVHVAGKEVNKLAVQVKDDDGNMVLAGIHSDGYNLIPNSLARDVTDDIMSRSGMEWANLKTHWDGKRFVNYFYTKNAVTEFKNGTTYPMHLGMMVRNSYDGSSTFGLEFYGMNMVCLNQFISRKMMGYFMIKHTGDQKFDLEDATDNIRNGSQRLIEIAPRWQAMTKKELAVTDIIEARNKDLVPKIFWGEVIDQLGKEPDFGKLFGLYQALTFVSSHKIQGLSSLSHGNDITEHFFSMV